MAWQLDRNRYMSREEVRRLRGTIEDRANADLAKGRRTWVRNWAIIDFVTQTGLRVSELANVRVGDLTLRGSTPHVMVVGGKGRKGNGEKPPSREPVTLGSALVRHLNGYLRWKSNVGEGTDPGDFLFVSNRRGQYSARALQEVFKRACHEAGLPAHYSIHSARHSWGTYLYAKTKDLRLVQKELRHRNINTTTVYADVTPEAAAKAVENVYDDDGE